jgi:cupin fold WbuC family metalloprotein
MRRIDTARLERLSARAAASPRLRINDNLHPALEDPVQRLCNAMEPGTYVRPHRHLEPGKWELFVVLSGAAAVLEFDDSGLVTQRTELRGGGPVLAVEIAEATWHTIVALEPGTVLFEVKRGPYLPLSDKDFAPWAPAEGEPQVPRFLHWLLQAAPGGRPPRR